MLTPLVSSEHRVRLIVKQIIGSGGNVHQPRIYEIIAGLLLCLCGAILPAAAQDSELPPLADDIAAQFPAIGRFGLPAFNVTQGCSATLFAPELVLRAADCVSTSGQSGRVFAAGWRNGIVVAQAGTALEIRHPDYGVSGGHTPSSDVALVVLETPITAVDPMPLSPAEGAVLPDNVALIGYHFRSPDRLAGDLTCSTEPFSAGLLRIGCPVINGNSGGPVLTRSEDGTWQITGVVSSQFGGDAIAVILPDWLRMEVDAHLAD
jgi:hypothetical protein